MKPQNKNTTESVWLQIAPSDRHGCCEFQGYRNPAGYGQIAYQGKLWLAHRLIWTFVNGEIPEGLCILHKCDNPACCEPLHLELGTRAENNRQMKERGRAASGDRNGLRLHPESVKRGESLPQSRLNWGRVDWIRQRYSRGDITQLELARLFGVALATINFVIHNLTWKEGTEL